MCTVELSPDNTDKLIVIKSSANSEFIHQLFVVDELFKCF